MNFAFRETRLAGSRPDLDVTDRAREARSRALLEKLGVTLPTAVADLKAWQCAAGPQVVGHCVGDLRTGEIRLLGVVAEYQGLGIGKKLLALTTASLRAAGAKRIWLAATSDPVARAHGFYRALGWRPTGERTQNGEEILELPTNGSDQLYRPTPTLA
jgi:ribosomal protein S18 acetylase RimI-like enzyme